MTHATHELPLSDRIGISTNLFLQEADTVALVRRLAERFNFVEIEIEGNVRKQTDDLKDFSIAPELRKVAEDTGTVLSVHAPYVGVDYIFGNDKDEARALLMRCTEFCADIGASTMTFHPGFRFSDSEGQARRQQAIDEIEALAYDMFNVGKKLGSSLELCLENMGNQRPFLRLSYEESEQLFSSAPLSLTLDMNHCLSFTEDKREAMETLAQFARFAKNVHLSDMNFPRHVHLPLGYGDLDIDEAIRTIEASGYRGAYIVEEIGGGYKGEVYTDATIKYREHVAGLEQAA